jgi:hypothetical protein
MIRLTPRFTCIARWSRLGLLLAGSCSSAALAGTDDPEMLPLTSEPEAYRVINNANPPYIFTGKGVLTTVHLPEAVQGCESESVGYKIDWFGRGQESKVTTASVVSISTIGREIVDESGQVGFRPPPPTNVICHIGSEGRPIAFNLRFNQTRANGIAYLYYPGKPPKGAAIGDRNHYRSMMATTSQSVVLGAPQDPPAPVPTSAPMRVQKTLKKERKPGVLDLGNGPGTQGPDSFRFDAKAAMARLYEVMDKEPPPPTTKGK